MLIEVNNEPFQKNPEYCRKSLFAEIDQPALKPLPPLNFEYVTFKKAKVNIDYHVECKGHYYSVPYTLVGKTVELKITNNTVEIFYDNKSIAKHMCNSKRGAHTTITEHMPTKHQKHVEWTTDRFLNWAATIGPETTIVVKNIIQKKKHPEQGYRACLGLLSLAKKFGPERLEIASGIAHKVKSYRRITVLLILENKADFIEKNKEWEVQNKNINHNNIRGPEYFNKK